MTAKRAREIICVERPASVETVNDAGYLAANPDVRKAGVSAKDHYLLSGRQEGRQQWVNLDQVAALREEKLKSIRFRRASTEAKRHGQALNFLSRELIAEFEIPESPPVSANQYGGPFIDEIMSHPDRICLDVGAGLRHSYVSNVVNTEIYASISTDVVCVGEDLPFENDQFDYVMCMAVLEHTRRPWDVAREICRVLKPGGKLLVDYPFLVGVHGYPHHYFNATPQGAISLFEDKCEILSSVIESNNHPMQSIWWLLAVWRSGLSDADQAEFEKLSIGKLLSMPPDQHMDAGYCKNLSKDIQRVIPAGSTLTARKKN